MFAALLVAVVVLTVVASVAYRKGRAQGVVDAQRAMRRGEHLASRQRLDGRNGERVTLVPVTRAGHD